MDNNELLKLLNTDNNPLRVWQSHIYENILTEHYNYLWEHTKQLRKNVLQKSLSFQSSKQNDNGTYNTFDFIVLKTKRKADAFYEVTEIKKY